MIRKNLTHISDEDIIEEGYKGELYYYKYDIDNFLDEVEIEVNTAKKLLSSIRDVSDLGNIQEC